MGGSETVVEGTPTRSLFLKIICALAVVEAAVMLGVTGWFVIELLTERARFLGGAIFLAGLSLVVSVWLFAAGHFLWRHHRWPRSALIFWQICQLSVAVPTLGSGRILLGLAIAIPSIVVIVLLFFPQVLKETTPPKPGSV